MSFEDLCKLDPETLNAEELDMFLRRANFFMHKKGIKPSKHSEPKPTQHLVRLLTDDSGEQVEEPKWCLVITVGGSNSTFCTNEFFGYWEGDAQYDEKWVVRGGITCQDCLARIKEIKSVRL
jgi:hypothetical protein